MRVMANNAFLWQAGAVSPGQSTRFVIVNREYDVLVSVYALRNHEK